MKKDKLVILICALVGVLVVTGIVYLGSAFSTFSTFNTNTDSTSTNTDSASQPENLFPQQFEGFNLVKLVSGPEAIEQISQLHGSEIAIEEGYIAMYQGNSGEMVLWVSSSGNEAEAENLLQVMDRKIPQSRVFSNHRIETIKNMQLHYVYGMNMDNYYYRIGTKVYWVGLPAKSSQELMVKVLENF